MNRIIATIIIVLLLSPFSRAQDSVSCRGTIGWGWAGTTVALMAAGTSTHYVGAWEDFNPNVREGMQTWRNEGPMNGMRIHVDDYLQYGPIAATLALKACGVESRDNWKDLCLVSVETYAAVAAVVLTTKELTHIQRPDGSSYNTFPSGHTATAFAGAEVLRMEFWDASPAIGILGYCAAASTGLMRIYNNRHWAGDVLAGAGVGILSARFANWLNPKVDALFQPQGRQQASLPETSFLLTQYQE